MAPMKHLTKRLVGHRVLGKVVENLLAIQLIGLSNLVNSKKKICWKVIHVTILCIAVSGLQLSYYRNFINSHGRIIILPTERDCWFNGVLPFHII